jgi:serine/threonine protein kinase
MELVTGVSLLNYLKAKPDRRIVESDCKILFMQITQGISYCHLKNIVHRDIKLENIIIETAHQNRAKLIDFGFGTICPLEKLQNFFCGTPSYMPPEIVQKKDYIGINKN